MALPDERFEICHLLDAAARTRILPALRLRLLPCPLAGPAGRQRVQSLYFGDPPENGVTPRRRLRLRLHEADGRPLRCVVEVKHRIGLRSVVRHAAVSLGDAQAIASAMPVISPLGASARAVVDEAIELARTTRLRPTCLVTHDRTALVGSEDEPDLRVTLDDQMTFRARDLTLRPGGARAEGDVLTPGHVLLVVKVAHAVPNWLTLLIGRTAARRSPGKHCLAMRAAALFAEPAPAPMPLEI